MKNLNLALKLSYDGKAVTTGARANASDIAALENSTRGAGTAASKSASQLKTLTTNTSSSSIAATKASTASRTHASNLRLVERQAIATSTAVKSGSSNNALLASSYSKVTAAVSGFLALSTAQSIVSNVAQIQQLNVRLQSLTVTSEQYGATQEYLFELANRHNKAYLTLADSYSRILTLQKSGIVTQTEGRNILEGMSNAASALGASNTQLEQSLFGMTQGFTAGTLRAEELNQVTEPLPGLMQELDKASGQVAGGFRTLVNDGQVTSAMFKDTLIKALESYEGASEKMANTVPGGLSRINTAYSNLIQTVEGDVNSGLVPVLDSVASTINALADSETAIDNITDAAVLLATVFAGRMVTSLATSTQLLVAKTVATETALRADVALTQQQVALATETNRVALSQQAAAQRALANATSTETRTRAIKNLAIANGQARTSQVALTAATNAQTLAATRATTATRVATIAMRGFKATMALLGGPAGIAMLAAYGIYQFLSSTDDATTSAKSFTGALSDTNKELSKLTVKQLKVKLFELENDGSLDEAKKQLDELKAHNASTGESGSDFNSAIHNRPGAALYRDADIEALELKIAKVKKYKDTISELLKEPTQSSDPKKPVKTDNTPTLSKNDSSELAKIESALASEEQRIQSSYATRLALLNKAQSADSSNKAHYAELSKQLLIKRNADLQALREQQAEQAINKDLANVEASLLNEEQRIRQSYASRITIVDDALNAKQVSQERHDAITKQLIVARDEEIATLALEQAEKIKAAEQQAEDDKVASANERRELAEQQRNDAWNNEILQLQGFHSRKEAEEQAHELRKMQVKTAKTGELQGTLLEFANWQEKTELDKTSAVIGIGEAGFKAMGEQSSKAFALYKAFAISQAMIKTYEAATGAYAALAPIPIVGPALGVAAAGAAIAMGISQVRTIAAQQPSGYEQGGSIGNQNVIEFGERNKPEVLEYGGQNYLLGGNGGAVFNRSQLEPLSSSGTSASSKSASGNNIINIAVKLVESAERAGEAEQTGDEELTVFVADIRGGGERADVLETTYGLQRVGT